jgi:hypothetical protein
MCSDHIPTRYAICILRCKLLQRAILSSARHQNRKGCKQNFRASVAGNKSCFVTQHFIIQPAPAFRRKCRKSGSDTERWRQQREVQPCTSGHGCVTGAAIFALFFCSNNCFQLDPWQLCSNGFFELSLKNFALTSA